MKKYLKYLLLFFVIGIVFSYSHVHNTPTSKVIIKDSEVQNVVGDLRTQYNNNDIVGTIEIDGTDINEIVVQADDNSYYLTHDLYKNHDIYGSVFLDHRCDKNSKKLLVFGHNDFRDKTPFSDLENYMDSEYFKSNQFINLLIDDRLMKFQIFSVYIETSDFTYMNLKIDDNQYNQDLLKYKRNSFYDTGVSVSADDRILILQTCSNHKDYQKFKDKYLLIFSKLVE
ncbi:MAG: class B sortase [Bacilli bacterium]|nr:class B sortase [Bacilli bacterium]